MKKAQITIFVIIAILIVTLILFFAITRTGFNGQGEDSWIKDSRGVYIKHGFPSETPNYVLEQQEAINCANRLYNQKKAEGMQFNSQCLGTCGGFVVDVVHSPRTEEDNLIENQCEDFRNGKVKNFIELDKNGEIVRIV